MHETGVYPEFGNLPLIIHALIIIVGHDTEN